MQNLVDELQSLAPDLLKALSVPLLACDAQGQIVFTNPAAENQLNARVGVALSEPLPKLAEAVGNYRRSATSAPPLTITRGTGAPYLALLSTVNSVEGQNLTLCLLPPAPSPPESDQRMQDFEALTLELHAIIDSSSDGLFVCNADAKVIRVNPASERIHQRPAVEMVGKNMRDLIVEGFIDRSAALEASIQKKTISQLQNLPGGGKLISVATPVFDQNGDLIRVVVSERDISEIDRLQRELEHQESIKDQFRHQILEMQQS